MDPSILRVRRRPSLVEPRSFPRSAMTLPRRRVNTGQPVTVCLPSDSLRVLAASNGQATVQDPAEVAESV